MYSFPTLLKKIRKESGLTQEEFARALNVSTILISMIETGQKDISKNFVLKLADKLDVHPSSITPFMFVVKGDENRKTSMLEKKLISFGEELQKHLIKVKSKKLKKDV